MVDLAKGFVWYDTCIKGRRPLWTALIDRSGLEVVHWCKIGTLGGGIGLLAGLRMGSGRSAAGGPDAMPSFYPSHCKAFIDYIINGHWLIFIILATTQYNSTKY